MLRPVLVGIGAVALGLALAAAIAGAPLPLILWLGAIGATLIGGILFERGRYKPGGPAPPGPGWTATGERFFDPASGEEVTVYYQPSSGERRYVGR